MAEHQPVTPLETSKRLSESSKTHYQRVTMTHVKLKQNQHHQNSIELHPWPQDYDTCTLFVVAGVHDKEVRGKKP